MDQYRSTWWKAFDDYGVDVVLGGHLHYYLRSKPINLNVSTDSAVDEYGSCPMQGRLQVISGNIGAPLLETGSGWFIEKNVSTMNYTKFEINGHVLKMNAYNISGTLIDSVTIHKQVTGVTDLETKTPTEFTLNQNFPNPFNSSTVIKYMLPKDSDVKLTIFNVGGQEISILKQGIGKTGKHSVTWNASGMPSGLYFYKLETDDFTETKKMLLL